MILSQKVAHWFLRRKKEYYNSGKSKNLMIIPSKLSSSYIPINEIKNTNSKLGNTLKRQAEGKKRRCLCSYSTLRCLIEGREGGGGWGGGGLEKFKKPNRQGGWNRLGGWKMIQNVINGGLKPTTMF